MNKLLIIFLTATLCCCVQQRIDFRNVTGNVDDIIDAVQLLRDDKAPTDEKKVRALIYANEITGLLQSRADRKRTGVVALGVTSDERGYLSAPIRPRSPRIDIGLEKIHKDESGNYYDRATKQPALIIWILLLKVDTVNAEAHIQTSYGRYAAAFKHYKLAKAGNEWRIVECKVTSLS